MQNSKKSRVWLYLIVLVVLAHVSLVKETLGHGSRLSEAPEKSTT